MSSLKGRATLVLFVHPQCPCSKSTIEELAHIVAHSLERVNGYVFFYSPEEKPSDWARTGLWQSASMIPGVRAMEDPDGREARRFHAATSGQTLLYDAAGHLRFSGGITAARGHSGDNDGRDTIISLVLTGWAALKTTPVFGCSLLGEARR